LSHEITGFLDFIGNLVSLEDRGGGGGGGEKKKETAFRTIGSVSLLR
jgi:hypothetical protein